MQELAAHFMERAKEPTRRRRSAAAAPPVESYNVETFDASPFPAKPFPETLTRIKFDDVKLIHHNATVAFCLRVGANLILYNKIEFIEDEDDESLMRRVGEYNGKK